MLLVRSGHGFFAFTVTIVLKAVERCVKDTDDIVLVGAFPVEDHLGDKFTDCNCY